MHELSLCQAVARTVADHADGRRVSRVVVRVGHLRQVVPDSMRFSWEVLTAGTPLAGCELAIEHVPPTVRCASCGSRTTLDSPLIRCGRCRGLDVVIEAGDELLVESIDVSAVRP